MVVVCLLAVCANYAVQPGGGGVSPVSRRLEYSQQYDGIPPEHRVDDSRRPYLELYERYDMWRRSLPPPESTHPGAP